MVERLVYGFSGSPITDLILGYREVLGLMLFGMGVHLLPEGWKEQYRRAFSNAPMYAQVGITCCAILAAYAGLSSGMQPFIYFQF